MSAATLMLMRREPLISYISLRKILAGDLSQGF